MLDSSASWRREGHRQKPESPDAANFRRVDRLAGEVKAKVASPTENLEEDTRHREAVNYSTLSWHIASTALKVWITCPRRLTEARAHIHSREEGIDAGLYSFVRESDHYDRLVTLSFSLSRQ